MFHSIVFWGLTEIALVAAMWLAYLRIWLNSNRLVLDLYCYEQYFLRYREMARLWRFDPAIVQPKVKKSKAAAKAKKIAK